MARVIKGGGGDDATSRVPVRARVIKAESVDARTEARAIVAAAHAEAHGIRAAAETLGRAAGDEAARAHAAELLVRAEVAGARRAAAEAPKLGALAIRIASRLLGRELAQTPEAVLDVVRTALAEAVGRRRVTIRVAASDREVVEQGLARLAASVPGAAFDVTEDDAVDAGGCVLDTEIGRIDARLATQLAAIERALGEGET